MKRRTAALGLALVAQAAALSACAPSEVDSSAAAGHSAETLTELPGMPDDFTPTEGGEALEFGETAHVVTTGFDTGQPVYFEVTVEKPKKLTSAEVEENIGQDPGEIGLPEPEEGEDPPQPERYDSFTCFIVTFTPVAVGEGNYSVSLPWFKILDPGGLNANFVERGDNAYCGVNPDDEVPAFTGDMEEGREYKRAIVTWTGATAPGIVGTAVELNTVQSPKNSAQPWQSITWK
ncbi:hypothetical protein [Corynebacterium sanguinis]|uniref:hypothetical protein n=1 Tax=Corynebacterium sanguinis TaxID=2594913 RepID=UPI00223A77DD|nr:hypothetical protein [Corynebacterium sanguinis]MCT1596800.1 hypothetical protein [Corynebacterium sanguinis]